MNDSELAELLALTVASAPPGLKTSAYYLFGIRYAGELEGRTPSIVRLDLHNHPEAEIPEPASAQVADGVRLSNFVDINNVPNWLA